MNPERIEVSGFTVSGLTVRTKNSDEFNPATAKIAGTWGRFFTEGLPAKIPHQLTGSPVYGVYSGYESDATGFYDLTAGMAVSQGNSDFSTVTVEAGTYLQFTATGLMPAAVIHAWGQVWAYFAENPQIARRFGSDYEAYTGTDQVKVCIGIL
jgi:predicted transcriptional regulator YdeE